MITFTPSDLAALITAIALLIGSLRRRE